MSLDLDAIHRGIADQLRLNMAADVNVYPWPVAAPMLDALTLEPDNDYLAYFATFGADGLTDLQIRIRVELDALDDESLFVKMARFLSSGADFPSSIPDAIMQDPTIGGLVQNCVPLSAQWGIDGDLGPAVAFVPLSIIVKKSGAES